MGSTSNTRGGAKQDRSWHLGVLGTIAVAGLLLVSGCAIDSQDSSGSDASGGDAASGADAIDADAVEAAASASERKQVSTASMKLDVDVLERSVDEASESVKELGGFVGDSNIDLGSKRQATVVYRVPADTFDQALASIAEVGDLRNQEVTTDDVTATYADLEGRVTALRTSVGRLNGLLGESIDVNQITSLESELARRESDLESLETQRRALADRIELSTITAVFTGSEARTAVDESRSLPTFLGGLESGWDLLVGAAAFALAAFGFLAPFLPLLLVMVLLARWLRARSWPDRAIEVGNQSAGE